MLECEHDHGDATRDDTIMMPVTNTTLATSDSVLETSALHVIRTSILTNIQEKHLSYSNSAFILTFLLSFTTGALPIFLQERIILMRETSSGSYRISSYVIAKRRISLIILLHSFCNYLLFTTPLHWLVGLRRKIDGFLYFCLVAWMVLSKGNSFAAAFISGMSLIAGIMVVMLAFIVGYRLPCYLTLWCRSCRTRS
ncbi:unnamed protein product [Coffea canephora]|uniref:ABC-2 type transporter transmembrane domain-containing protein n=1 Tax=Coffea canephora TaxID=49390 RepID=A0A068V2G0_COFCA|nr:unnamed protein product [Coffea canephora]